MDMGAEMLSIFFKGHHAQPMPKSSNKRTASRNHTLEFSPASPKYSGTWYASLNAKAKSRVATSLLLQYLWGE